MDAFLSTRLGHDEVLLRNTQILNVSFQLGLNEALELLMYFSKLEWILLSVFKNDAFLFDKADDWILPHWRLEKLRHDLQDPFLDVQKQRWLITRTQLICLPCHPRLSLPLIVAVALSFIILEVKAIEVLGLLYILTHIT